MNFINKIISIISKIKILLDYQLIINKNNKKLYFVYPEEYAPTNKV